MLICTERVLPTSAREAGVYSVRERYSSASEHKTRLKQIQILPLPHTGRAPDVTTSASRKSENSVSFPSVSDEPKFKKLF